MHEIEQILHVLDLGVVILDRSYHVLEWNHWMQIHSDIKKENIVGSSVFNFFPDMNYPAFTRACRSVFTFGNILVFSQKLHNYLFPFKVKGIRSRNYTYMQQSCTLSPIRESGTGDVDRLLITIQDVTERAVLEHELRNLTLRDELTGIYNRRHFDTRMREEVSRHKRYGHPMSLILFDLDFFKEVNDCYGHQAGDVVLKKVADLGMSGIRGGDIFTRYGGEEFACILPDTALPGARIVAERLLQSVAETEYQYRDYIMRTTISLGISELDPNKDSIESLIRRTDEALYEAKRSGRNCIIEYRYEKKDEGSPVESDS